MYSFSTVIRPPHLRRIVDVGVPVQQEGGYVFVAVVRGYVQRREARLGSDVGVVVVLQEQPGGLGVVFLGSNVQRRKPDLEVEIL